MAINHIIYFLKLAFRALCVWLYKVYMRETNQVLGTCTLAIWKLTCNWKYCKYEILHIDINLLSSIVQSLTFSFKHGSCFKISIYWNPKPKEVTFQQHGLSVDKGYWKWKGTYNWSWMHIHATCTSSKIYKQWTKSWKFLNGTDVKMSRIQNHLGDIWYDVLFFNFII